eukprot:scaffold6173_cov64-Phaeocystis_antarctica.AAC.1
MAAGFGSRANLAGMKTGVRSRVRSCSPAPPPASAVGRSAAARAERGASSPSSPSPAASFAVWPAASGPDSNLARLARRSSAKACCCSSTLEGMACRFSASARMPCCSTTFHCSIKARARQAMSPANHIVCEAFASALAALLTTLPAPVARRSSSVMREPASASRAAPIVA